MRPANVFLIMELSNSRREVAGSNPVAPIDQNPLEKSS